MEAHTQPVWFPILDPELGSRAVADSALADRFVFHGEEHELRPGFDWTVNPSRDRQWLIQLLKFPFAPALGAAWRETGDERYAAKWIELTASWIARAGSDFSPSDVTGRRIQNQISAWYFFENAPGQPRGFRGAFLESISAQVSWLREHLSPARNHRTLELLALFLAAVAFPDPAGAAFARDELAANALADFRPDGVHCEQSTDYHHTVLRNLIAARRLADLNRAEMPPEFDAVIRKALEFALHAHRPDGKIPAFSDGDSRSYADVLAAGHALYGDPRLLWAATKGREGTAPRETCMAFPDGGYYILRSGWGEAEPYEDERFLLFDCGPLGEGNHGHLDWLSFELYGHGRPLIVDPGRYTYDESGEPNWRAWFRGTAAHNTVLVDGRDQARYAWHRRRQRFKVLGAEPRVRLLGFGPGFVHGAIESAEYPAVHERRIEMREGSRFVVIDTLRSPEVHRYEQIFHLAPEAEGRVSIRQALPCEVRVESGWVSPAYGVRHAAPVLRYTQTGREARFETHIEVLAPQSL